MFYSRDWKVTESNYCNNTLHHMIWQLELAGCVIDNKRTLEDEKFSYDIYFPGIDSILISSIETQLGNIPFVGFWIKAVQQYFWDKGKLIIDPKNGKIFCERFYSSPF